MLVFLRYGLYLGLLKSFHGFDAGLQITDRCVLLFQKVPHDCFVPSEVF
jgi:hypothetical protein